jgi:DNA methylase
MPKLWATSRPAGAHSSASGFIHAEAAEGNRTQTNGAQKMHSNHRLTAERFRREPENFQLFGTAPVVGVVAIGSSKTISVFTNEFWTSKQRAACSLHEISYRACFKPQLPRFFIERLTQPGDLVYDPFMGRGTTLLESVVLGRRAVGCDISPLSAILLGPRLNPPTLEQVRRRLYEINWEYASEAIVARSEELVDECAFSGRRYL